MKLTLITRHFFSAYNRKTTVHFLAREFVKRGFTVDFVSVGRSRLSTFNKPKGKGIPLDLSRTEFTEIEPNIFSIVMNEWVHPISARPGLVSRLTSPDLISYGQHLPKNIKRRVSDSEVILIECGYGVAYYDYLRTICPKAKFIYFATDPLSQVGLREEFETIEMESITRFDVVRVASDALGDRFPKETNLIVIPQGIDKSVFDLATESPYEPDSLNLISIGDMSFDYTSMIEMADLRPDAKFHIFGADVPIANPDNIIVHGEVNFSQLVPYIKFADVGIMAYKMNTEMTYLTKTSLKFLQYSYCGLPILTPVGPDWERKNVFQYKLNEQSSLEECLTQALATPKDDSLSQGIVDWGDCADQLLAVLND